MSKKPNKLLHKNIELLVKVITEVEHKTVQVSIGNVREIVAILSDISYAEPSWLLSVLHENGKRRVKQNEWV